MRYTRLGTTGLYVSELCLGTMTFGGGDAGIWSHIGKLQQDEVDGLVRRSIEAGINFLDTANVYSAGRSEELTGQALKNLGVNGYRTEELLEREAPEIAGFKPTLVTLAIGA